MTKQALQESHFSPDLGHYSHLSPEQGKVTNQALQESHFLPELGKVTNQALQEKNPQIHHDITSQSHIEGRYGSSIPCYHHKQQWNTILLWINTSPLPFHTMLANPSISTVEPRPPLYLHPRYFMGKLIRQRIPTWSHQPRHHSTSPTRPRWYHMGKLLHPVALHEDVMLRLQDN